MRRFSLVVAATVIAGLAACQQPAGSPVAPHTAKLTEAEAWTLAEALRVNEPWLEWAGKRETKSFAVELEPTSAASCFLYRPIKSAQCFLIVACLKICSGK